ncbi:MAG TPA: MBL fold metallo-hydrolase [Peptococcaceae bacterium]|nr:MBL fold metallo-hydrolase [Peptococcaceae bacterium]
MTKQSIKIQYLYHSGFRVETNKHILIFDYYQGNVNWRDKTTLVFVSHAHPDHYNPVIWKWRATNPAIKYILSDDLRTQIPPELLAGTSGSSSGRTHGKDNIKENFQENNSVIILPPYQKVRVGDVLIKTYGSTDVGVSFLVEADGMRIFHAGDLNWWHWWGEQAEDIARAEVMFKEEMAKIKEDLAQEVGQTIDFAFFPVDQRLEHNYCLGADYFIEKLAPRFLIPMHFGDHLETAHKYAQKMINSPTKIITFEEKGQEIILQV